MLMENFEPKPRYDDEFLTPLFQRPDVVRWIQSLRPDVATQDITTVEE
jgi:hypothetical protein